MESQYSNYIQNIFLLILSLKKKIVTFFLLLLIGSIIAYPIVGFVVKDITSRNIPYSNNVNNVEYLEGKYIFYIKNVHFQIVSNFLEINQKIILQYISIEIIKDESFFIIESKINNYLITYKHIINYFYDILLLKKNSFYLQYKTLNKDDIYIYKCQKVNFINKNNFENDLSSKKNINDQTIMIFHNYKNILINSQKDLDPIIIYTKPLEVTILNMKYSFIFGFLFTLPYLFYIIINQLEKSFSLKLILKKKLLFYFFVTSLTFIIGFFSGYFICSPFFINFLYFNASYSGIQATYTISHFVSFILLISLLFGFLFEFPIILILLNKINFVQLKTLEKYRKHIYVLFFIFSGIITPPDVFTQLIVAIPMIIFYEISIFIMKLYT